MVSMDMCLEQALDSVPLFDDKGEQAVGGLGGDGVAGRVKVQDRVDDDGGFGGWVGYDVLPGRGIRLEAGVDDGLGHGCGWVMKQRAW